MKKTVFVFLSAMMLWILLPFTVSAAGVKEPVIEGDMPDCYIETGNSLILFTNASSQDGGTLEYQWYSTSVGEISTIRAIDGETEKTFRVPEILGVRWYCYAVWNTSPSGLKSSPVYSRLIRVEFYEKEEYSVEIVETPKKLEYTSGERLDLTGLKVRVYTPDGFFDSVNGEKLQITDKALVTTGEQKIKVAYGDAFDVFYVTVLPAHTHKYGEWTVTEKPTCTSPGIQVRECDCGDTQRASVPATGHKYGEWMITEKPTCTTTGIQVRECDCGDSQRASVPATGHKYGAATTANYPPSPPPGIQVRECDCGDTQRASVPALGHQWDRGKITKLSTSETDGEKTFTCTVCKATRTETFKANRTALAFTSPETAGKSTGSSVLSETVSKASGLSASSETVSKSEEASAASESTGSSPAAESSGKPEASGNTESVSASSETGSTSPASPESAASAVSAGTDPVSGQENERDFPWWIILVAAGSAVCGAVIATVLGKRKK